MLILYHQINSKQALGDTSSACCFVKGGEDMEVKKDLDSKPNRKDLTNNKNLNDSKEENLSDIENLMKHRSYKRRRGALKQISS